MSRQSEGLSVGPLVTEPWELRLPTRAFFLGAGVTAGPAGPQQQILDAAAFPDPLTHHFPSSFGRERLSVNVGRSLPGNVRVRDNLDEEERAERVAPFRVGVFIDYRTEPTEDGVVIPGRELRVTKRKVLDHSNAVITTDVRRTSTQIITTKTTTTPYTRTVRPQRAEVGDKKGIEAGLVSSRGRWALAAGLFALTNVASHLPVVDSVVERIPAAHWDSGRIGGWAWTLPFNLLGESSTERVEVHPETTTTTDRLTSSERRYQTTAHYEGEVVTGYEEVDEELFVQMEWARQFSDDPRIAEIRDPQKLKAFLDELKRVVDNPDITVTEFSVQGLADAADDSRDGAGGVVTRVPKNEEVATSREVAGAAFITEYLDEHSLADLLERDPSLGEDVFTTDQFKEIHEDAQVFGLTVEEFLIRAHRRTLINDDSTIDQKLIASSWTTSKLDNYHGFVVTLKGFIEKTKPVFSYTEDCVGVDVYDQEVAVNPAEFDDVEHDTPYRLRFPSGKLKFLFSALDLLPFAYIRRRRSTYAHAYLIGDERIEPLVLVSPKVTTETKVEKLPKTHVEERQRKRIGCGIALLLPLLVGAATLLPKCSDDEKPKPPTDMPVPSTERPESQPVPVPTESCEVTVIHRDSNGEVISTTTATEQTPISSIQK